MLKWDTIPSLDREPEPPAPYIPSSVPVPGKDHLPPPPEVPLAPRKNVLDIFCAAIRDFEGNPGDRNYRNKNPGNVKYSPVGYLPMYEPVGCDKDGFAIFKDWDTGWLYLQNYVKSVAKRHPEWTILDFFHNYAPASDHNPTEAYAKNVAKRCGVTIHTKLKDLFTA